MQKLLFYIFAITAISSAIVVVKDKRPTYGVLALAVAMLALSGLFVLLQAYFVAAIQILIYAGAILVLFLFVIMLLGVSGVEETSRKNKAASMAKVRRAVKILLSFMLLAELMTVMLTLKDTKLPQENFQGTVEAIGMALFTNYLFPFELVSGILLIGIFGVVNLAHKEFESHHGPA